MSVARRSLLAGGTAGVGLVVAGAVPSLAEASPSRPRRPASARAPHRPFPPLMEDPAGHPRPAGRASATASSPVQA